MVRRLISTLLIATMILTSANFAIYAETEGADGQNSEITEQGKLGDSGDSGDGGTGSGSEAGESGGQEPGGNSSEAGESGGSGDGGSETGGSESGESGDNDDEEDPDKPDDPDEPEVTEVKAENLKTTYRGITTLTLTWDEIPQAESYKIYRGAGATGTAFALVSTVDTNKFKDTGLHGSWTYRYKVVPVLKEEFKDIKVLPADVFKVKMNAAAWSKTIPYVTVKNYKDPKVGLKSYNTVKWEGLTGAKGYVIYRANTKSGKFKKIATVGADKRSYNDSLARSGKYAYYKVRAYKGLVKKSYTRYSEIKSIKTIVRVYIACGHGMQTNGVWDAGCAYKGMNEAKLMLPITKAMVAEMRASGVYVYTDADKDNNLNMTYCVRNANRREVSVYMSIHCDYSGAPKGTMPLYYSKEDLVLAKALNKGVHGEVSIADRKPCKRWDLFELRTPKAKACCIFETGSIKYDNEVFRKKPKAYGRGLAKGLCNYLGVQFHA